MNDDDDDMLAALWAAGALPAPQHRAARQRVKVDPAFAARTRDWEDGLAPLALAVPALAPPAGAFASIEARLDARARFEWMAKTLQEPETLREPDEADWIHVAPGLRLKVLEEYPEMKRQMILLEGAPGAVHAGHYLEQDEEIYVVSGDLVVDEAEFGPGDFHVWRKGAPHPDMTTRSGCRCLCLIASTM